MHIYNKKLLLVLVLLCFPLFAFANVIWPAYIAEEKILSLPIIAISLLIEYFFFKYLFHINTKKALYYTLVANAMSTLLGVVLRPLSGIVWEISLGLLVTQIFDWGTFNPITWISVPILGGAVNALLELLTIRVIGKQKFSTKNYVFTWGINTITIALATVLAIFQ